MRGEVLLLGGARCLLSGLPCAGDFPVAYKLIAAQRGGLVALLSRNVPWFLIRLSSLSIVVSTWLTRS